MTDRPKRFRASTARTPDELRARPCKDCGGPVGKTGGKATRCHDCQTTRVRAQAKARADATRAMEYANRPPKQCRRCGQPIPDTVDRRRDLHPECANLNRQEAYARAQERQRQRVRDRRRSDWNLYDRALSYGATPEQATRAQAATHCAICGRHVGRQGVVDHDHTTGHVRGVLCSNCNWALGGFADDPARMIAAARYVLGLAVSIDADHHRTAVFTRFTPVGLTLWDWHIGFHPRTAHA